MRTLKRSECSVLHLVLKGKWFDMIESGEKKEEYRADTPHWGERPEPHYIIFLDERVELED